MILSRTATIRQNASRILMIGEANELSPYPDGNVSLAQGLDSVENMICGARRLAELVAG